MLEARAKGEAMGLILSEIRGELAEWQRHRAHRLAVRRLIEKHDDLHDLRGEGSADFWLGIGGAIGSLILLVFTWTGTFEAWIGLPLTLLGVFLTIRQFFKDRRDRRELREKTRQRMTRLKVVDFATYSLVDISKDLKMPEGYEESGYRIEYLHHGFGAWSPEVCDWLIGAAEDGPGYSHGETEFRPRKVVRNSIAPLIELDRTASGQVFRNDAKIRLKTDLVKGPDGAFPGEIRLQRTYYLTTLCTNDLTFKEVIDREDRTMLYDGFTAFSRREGETLHILPLRNSGCANQLGISTLAFTSDNYLILVDQTRNNLQSAGLLAPSGSGSLDEADLPSPGCSGPFVPWILEVCKRELREELGLAESDEFTPDLNARLKAVDVDSRMIGYCTYLHRGSKPEFFFLARLTCSAAELQDIAEHSKEEKELSRRFAEEEDLRLAFGEPVADGLKRIAATLRHEEGFRLSFPLEMQLLLVEHAADRHADILEAFFADPA